MKKALAVLLLIIAGLQLKAQDVNKLISQSDVERIVKTLSADSMQGRATFTPGIEKAARFIEGEFKSIGLSYWPGSNTYWQCFSLVRAKPVKLSVCINSKMMGADSVFVMGAAQSFNWENNADVQVVKLGAETDFRKAYPGYLNDSIKHIVLVDTHFKAAFKSLHARAAKGGLEFEHNNGQPVVFVLGKFDEVRAFSVNYTVKSEQLPLCNMVGIIPGKGELKNEFVIFSGHYDHLGIIKPMQGDSIANGADDDASGTTAMITLARYYKAIGNNNRTLVFVAFTAEEMGEYGSQYFARHIDADKTVAMFNIEMIGKPSKFGPNSAFITGFDRSNFGAILQHNLAGTAFKFYPDPYPAQNLFYRSDNASLAKVGVPAHTISTDQIDTDTLYHTVKDEFSTLDVGNITATIRAIALSSRTIVNGTDTPKRVAKLR